MGSRGSFSVVGLARNLALSVVSILVGLVFLEVGVRLVAPQDLDFYNAEKIMRPSTRPGQSVEFIPNSANDSYVGVPVRINALGLRDREVAVPKPPGVFRVLAVGDSVTFGFGVRLEDTYAKRLEARLNAGLAGSSRRAEVINAGIEGTGLTYYSHFLRSMGPRLEPDLVLVGLVLNDIVEYREEARQEAPHRPPLSSRLRQANRFMRLNSHLFALVSTHLKSILYRIGVLDINTLYSDNFLTLAPPSERQVRAWTSSLGKLAELADLARSLKVPLVIVVFPMEVQLDARTLHQYRRTLGVNLDEAALSGAPQRRLAEYARDQKVPVADLLPPFRASRNGALFLRNHGISHDWAHPSPAGHEVAAEEIYRTLIRLGLVPTASAH